jgi:hypothetical protein
VVGVEIFAYSIFLNLRWYNIPQKDSLFIFNQRNVIIGFEGIPID